MESLYAQKSTAIAFAACWLVAVILVWGFHRQWWRVRAVSRAAWIVPIIALACIVAWGASVRSGAFAPTVVFAVISGFAAAAALGLVVVLPFSGAALTLERFVAWLRARTSRRNAAPGTSTIARIASGDPRSGVSDTSSAHRRASIEEPVRVAELASAADVDERRRSILTLAAAALPALAIGAAGAGVAGSYGRTRFPIVPLYYRDLPGALEGLRILHLSDIHLGYFVALDDLERTLLGAESHRADLVLVTGDVSDNLLILGDALRMIAHLEPRLGIYASVGNHE
jgi:hypothetical protein